MMTPAQRQWKRYSLLLSVLYFVAGYFLSDWLSRDRVWHVLPAFGWDRAIPFVPEAIWGYLLPYPTILLTYFLINDFARYHTFVTRYVILTTIHFLFFLIVPIQIIRPAFDATVSLSTQLTQFYYTIDPPRNLFPSLHASLPLLCAISLWRLRRMWSLAVFTLTGIIVASVLLVKQHYIIDIAASLLLVPALCGLKYSCSILRTALLRNPDCGMQ